MRLTCLRIRVSAASSALSLHFICKCLPASATQIPTFGGNETMRPNCGGSKEMRPTGYQRRDKAGAIPRLDYGLDETMLQPSRPIAPFHEAEPSSIDVKAPVESRGRALDRKRRSIGFKRAIHRHEVAFLQHLSLKIQQRHVLPYLRLKGNFE
jgi:hypothetical protein